MLGTHTSVALKRETAPAFVEAAFNPQQATDRLLASKEGKVVAAGAARPAIAEQTGQGGCAKCFARTGSRGLDANAAEAAGERLVKLYCSATSTQGGGRDHSRGEDAVNSGEENCASSFAAAHLIGARFGDRFFDRATDRSSLRKVRAARCPPPVVGWRVALYERPSAGEKRALCLPTLAAN
ncbi:hypothetical protein [Methylocella silvestris]|uniref:Uncharacterized protein n=1 Tax=Methylocella silvestris TaxID=199596 RepID=A0A2J7TI74_METSI|nr:hypothetical protein [Methylocella silvestris]PNG26475.1 hypothetical protein CR492_08770 [Methylocella silvestris]